MTKLLNTRPNVHTNRYFFSPSAPNLKKKFRSWRDSISELKVPQ